MNGQTWKPVVGFEKYYEVSNSGLVRSLRSNKKILATSKAKNGYERLSLRDDGGVQRTFYVHRLVAEAFHGTPEPGQEVAHNNGVRDDNHYLNLRWATRSENAMDQHRHGTAPVGERCPSSRLIESEVLWIRRHYSKRFNTNKMAKMFQVNNSTISRVLSRKSWSHI